MKWAPGGASASHSFPAPTATPAPMATFTTLSASVSGVALSHRVLVALVLVCLWVLGAEIRSRCADLKQSDTELL